MSIRHCAVLALVITAAPLSAHAEKVLGKVKVSTVAAKPSVLSSYRQRDDQYENHGQALSYLRDEATRVARVFPGATRHELVITKVKHSVKPAGAETLTIAKMSGEVTIYGD